MPNHHVAWIITRGRRDIEVSASRVEGATPIRPAYVRVCIYLRCVNAAVTIKIKEAVLFTNLDYFWNTLIILILWLGFHRGLLMFQIKSPLPKNTRISFERLVGRI